MLSWIWGKKLPEERGLCPHPLPPPAIRQHCSPLSPSLRSCQRMERWPWQGGLKGCENLSGDHSIMQCNFILIYVFYIFLPSLKGERASRFKTNLCLSLDIVLARQLTGPWLLSTPAYLGLGWCWVLGSCSSAAPIVWVHGFYCVFLFSALLGELLWKIHLLSLTRGEWISCRLWAWRESRGCREEAARGLMIWRGTGVFFSLGSVEIFLGFKCFLVERQVVKYEVIGCPKAAAYWKSCGKGMASQLWELPTEQGAVRSPQTGVQGAAGFACWASFTAQAFWRSLGINRADFITNEEKVGKNNAGICSST